MGDFGVTIAVPAVVGTFAGIWLDKHLGTSPWFLLLFLIATLTLTAYMIKQKAKRYGKEYDEMSKK